MLLQVSEYGGCIVEMYRNENLSGRANFGVLVHSERHNYECLLPDRRGPIPSDEYSMCCEGLESIYQFDFKLLECLLEFRQAVNGVFTSRRTPSIIIARNKDDDSDAPCIKTLHEKLPPPTPYTWISFFSAKYYPTDFTLNKGIAHSISFFGLVGKLVENCRCLSNPIHCSN
jgi:hypothetical protein